MRLRSKKILVTTIMVFALLCLALTGSVLSAYATPTAPNFAKTTATVDTYVYIGITVPQDTHAWFATSAQKTFKTEGSTMTMVYGENGAEIAAADAKIKAPKTAGTYKLFFVDIDGLYAASSQTLTAVIAPTTPSLISLPASGITSPGATVTLKTAPPKGLTAWLAPEDTSIDSITSSTFTAGNDMTKLVGDGSKKTISAPKTTGKYKLFYVNAVPEALASATAVLEVKDLPDKPEFTSASCKPGATITLDPALPELVYAWFAPATNKKFDYETSPNTTTITAAYGTSEIIAPTKLGVYKLFYSNDAGVAAASAGSLTVVADLEAATPPEITAQKIAPGGIITLKKAPPKGITAWLAPENTDIDSFSAGTDMTKIAGTGSLKKIAAPKDLGDYYLYYVNTAAQKIVSDDFITVEALPDKPVFTKSSYTVSTEDAVSSVTLDSAVPTGVTAWFAPKGIKFGKFKLGKTMTSVDGDDSIDTLDAPMTAGTYLLYYVNEVGAVASTGTLTTLAALTTPEIDENEYAPGAKIKLSVKPPKGVKAWLAPEGTEFGDFTNGTDMTSTTGKSIKAPKDEGTYYLYYVNAATSAVSDSSITVVEPEA